MLRRHRLITRVEQEEGARSVRVLRKSGGPAPLSEERRLLVSGDPCHGQLDAEVLGGRGPEVARTRMDRRQQPGGHAEQVDRPGIPVAIVQVVKLGTRRVGRVRDVGGSVGEASHQPAVDRADREFSGLGPAPQPGVGLQQPADLRSREVRIQDEPGPASNLVLVAGFPEGPAQGRGPPVLPDDRAVHGFERRPVPEDHRLALVGDAHGPDVGLPGPGERLARHPARDLPDLQRVVFDPARLGEVLRELGVRPPQNAPVLTDHETGGAGRALVDCENGGCGHVAMGSEGETESTTAGGVSVPNAYRTPASSSSAMNAPTGKPTTA